MSVIRDLLHGITPQKRKQIAAETIRHYEEQQEKLRQEIFLSHSFQDTVTKSVDIILSNHGLFCLEELYDYDGKNKGIDIIITHVCGSSYLSFQDGGSSENTDTFGHMVPNASWLKIPNFVSFDIFCVLFFEELQNTLPSHYFVSTSGATTLKQFDVRTSSYYTVRKYRIHISNINRRP